MFLQQQLNYCHMTLLTGDVECSATILYMYDICNIESYTSLSLYTYILASLLYNIMHSIYTHIYILVLYIHMCTCKLTYMRGPGLLVELHGVM